MQAGQLTSALGWRLLPPAWRLPANSEWPLRRSLRQVHIKIYLLLQFQKLTFNQIPKIIFVQICDLFFMNLLSSTCAPDSWQLMVKPGEQRQFEYWSSDWKYRWIWDIGQDQDCHTRLRPVDLDLFPWVQWCSYESFVPRFLKSVLVLLPQILGSFGSPKKHVNFDIFKKHEKCVVCILTPP